MKYVKVIVILTLCFAVSTAAAFAAFEFGLRFHSENETTELRVTDVNGRVIPNHTDVEKSVLSPEYFSRDERGRVTYSDPAVSIYTGVDVSVFQGDVDWEAVKNDGIDFVMLRVGYRGYGANGIMGEDANFHKNYEGAKKAGLKVGVYFFSQALNETEATEEANFVLDAVKDYPLDYPIAFDWEFVQNDEARTNDMTSESITLCAKAFCETVSQAGYIPVIYFSRETGYFSYDLTLVKDIGFWLAEYNESPSFYYNYKMWQYSKSGTVDGIDGAVDMNISIVDFSDSAAE